MERIATAKTATFDMSALAPVMQRVERRLGIALFALVASIIAILAGTVGQPAAQYLWGEPSHVSAGIQGAACGSHLVWTVEDQRVAGGTKIEFENASEYWQIPVQITKLEPDGTEKIVAESPVLKPGETWTQTFWWRGEYRIISADEYQRAAGLDAMIVVT